jgi:hypothetical protein
MFLNLHSFDSAWSASDIEGQPLIHPGEESSSHESTSSARDAFERCPDVGGIRFSIGHILFVDAEPVGGVDIELSETCGPPLLGEIPILNLGGDMAAELYRAVVEGLRKVGSWPGLGNSLRSVDILLGGDSNSSCCASEHIDSVCDALVKRGAMPGCQDHEMCQSFVEQTSSRVCALGLRPANVQAYVQMVLRRSYQLMSEELYYFASKVQFYNDLKASIREQLDRARNFYFDDAGQRREDGDPFHGQLVSFDPVTGATSPYDAPSDDNSHVPSRDAKPPVVLPSLSEAHASFGSALVDIDTVLAQPIFDVAWGDLTTPKSLNTGYASVHDIDADEQGQIIFTTPDGNATSTPLLGETIFAQKDLWLAWFQNLTPELQGEIVQDLAMGKLEFQADARVKTPNALSFFGRLGHDNLSPIDEALSILQNRLNDNPDADPCELFEDFIDVAANTLNQALVYESQESMIDVDYMIFGLTPSSTNTDLNYEVKGDIFKSSDPQVGVASNAQGSTQGFNQEKIEGYIEHLEQTLQSVGDDAQLAQIDLQNTLQKQQQLLTLLSNISKNWHDVAMSIVRNVGA